MNKVLALPQFSCVFGNELPETQLLFVAGGRTPEPGWLSQAALDFPVWCVDGGIDVCHANNIRPERLIGDGDSASGEAWRWGRKLGIPVECYPPEKNLTDLQLALQTAGSMYGQVMVAVTGVWGGRFDHTFSNIYSLKGGGSFGVRGCCAADEREALILVKGKDCARIETIVQPHTVSLLPLSMHCTGVCIDGVHWPLAGVKLHNGLPYAVSNRPVGSTFTVSIETGWLGIYLCWEKNKVPADCLK